MGGGPDKHVPVPIGDEEFVSSAHPLQLSHLFLHLNQSWIKC